jgi:pyridoxamine 5'-phosphate oxidase
MSHAPEPVLSEAMLADDPLAQFAAWLADAVAMPLPEPTAMVLATVSAAGQPRARTVLLKSYGPGGFVFYTNRTSRKGSDLAEVPRACLLFPWHPMQRQVIIEGPVSALTAEQSEPYYHSRPRGSQLGAWASRQSSVISSRAELDDRYAELELRWPEGTEVPMPEFWGGYQLIPEIAEFWQGRVNRMHDRLRYRLDGGQWLIERLAP